MIFFFWWANSEDIAIGEFWQISLFKMWDFFFQENSMNLLLVAIMYNGKEMMQTKQKENIFWIFRSGIIIFFDVACYNQNI